jgi:hypothetical protein
MRTFKHSGTLGDLIYSLPIVKKMGGGEFKVAINNIEDCVRKYSWGREDWAQVDPDHRGRFKESDYLKLKPLLERQSYIQSTSMWNKGDADVDVDLDHFRSTLFRTFEGNYVQGYHIAFNLPFTMSDYDATWLEADPNPVAPIVVYRSGRYNDPDGIAKWKEIVKDADLERNGTFVGLENERQDFIRDIGVDVPLCPINGFLELANVIAGAEMVICNQSFTYSLAMGLGKPTVLETMKMKPLQNNECFFPRTNVTYF